jgi:hypothetical protein
MDVPDRGTPVMMTIGIRSSLFTDKTLDPIPLSGSIKFELVNLPRLYDRSTGPDTSFSLIPRRLPDGKGRFSQKNIPENLEHIVHKKANKPRAIAASFVTPANGSVSSKIPSLVPSPLIVIGIMFTIPIIARAATIRPKLADMFKEMAST